MRAPLPLAAAVLLATAAPALANGGGAAAGPALVAMPEIVVPIVDGARAGGRLRLTLVLEAHDAAAAAKLTAELPRWREASFAAAAEFARIYASPMSAVDARRLVDEISHALHERDTDHAITRVLLTQVSAIRA